MGQEAKKLEEYVQSVSVEIRDDGIAAFKYQGETAENIRQIQARSGNEALALANDDKTRDITGRMTSVVKAR